MTRTSKTAKPIVLAGIHNHDTARMLSQRHVLDALSTKLGECGFLVIEVISSFQPAAPQIRPWFKLMTAVIPHFLNQQYFEARESRRRKLQPPVISLRKRWRIFKRAFKLATSRAGLSKAHERLHIEACLSRKHVDAWATLLNSSAEYAIVLEDDALLGSEGSADSIVKLLERYAGRADYIDLAGGYTREDLGLAGNPDEDLVLDFILANTTCAYILSRGAAETLLNIVFFEPRVLYLGSDFLIGTLSERAFDGTSVLPARLPLVHGSRSGGMPSSIPY